jgi:hypothetical protein
MMTLFHFVADDISDVVPAKAGTHNHRTLIVTSIVPHRYHTEYGTPPSRGRQMESCVPV